MGIPVKHLEGADERERGSRTLAPAALGAACGLSIVLLVFASDIVGFAGAVVTAIAWCVWIERHPDAPAEPGADRA
jgi:hypothetical protein